MGNQIVLFAKHIFYEILENGGASPISKADWYLLYKNMEHLLRNFVPIKKENLTF